MTNADPQLTRRILRAWRAASAEDLATGLAWYDRASDLAESLAAGAPITRETAAGVIAALSPRCGWSANVRGATKMVRAHVDGKSQPVVAGLPDNRDKGWHILQAGDDPLAYFSARTAPKTRSFYLNICGDTDAVTVDVWAAEAAEGKRVKRAPKGKRYARIADAYRRAAELAGVAPRDMQAAVWTYYRRTHARAIFDLEV